jgi:hypothetical protein
MSVKKAVWDQINKRVKRKKELEEKIASRRDNVESFVLEMIGEVDEMMASTVNTSLAPVLAEYYIASVHERLKTLDSGVKIEPSWQNDGADGTMPRLSGILLKWSKSYQKENNCDAELFVDVASLLFK